MANIVRHRRLNDLGVDLYVEFYGKSTAKDREVVLSEIVNSIPKQTIYFNDLSCKHWSFDYKLPCGSWVENIEYTDALATVNCMVY